MSGPLSGIRIIELAGIGPGPFAAMMLADHGAEVIRVERPGPIIADPVLSRNRRSILLDLKKPEAKQVLLDLVATADGLIEGLRPGVTERLGLGPETLHALNPRLVYGRMTGWGQTGPYAQAAGHDINYISLSGALHAYGRAGGPPTPPVNMVGDFGGGGMMLAFGMVSALLAARQSGQGQVIDCAMTDGSALLMGMIWGMLGSGEWKDQRGVNMLDTGSHYYDAYECADGRHISIGSLEPQFYTLLLQLLGLEGDPLFAEQNDPTLWPAQKEKVASRFLTQTRDHWCQLMEMTDVCFAPVLSMTEAPRHPHNVARGTFAEVGGVIQPMPAPRYSGTPTAFPRPQVQAGADTSGILADLGYDAARIDALKGVGALGPIG